MQADRSQPIRRLPLDVSLTTDQIVVEMARDFVLGARMDRAGEQNIFASRRMWVSAAAVGRREAAGQINVTEMKIVPAAKYVKAPKEVNGASSNPAEVAVPVEIITLLFAVGLWLMASVMKTRQILPMKVRLEDMLTLRVAAK